MKHLLIIIGIALLLFVVGASYINVNQAVRCVFMVIGVFGVAAYCSIPKFKNYNNG